MIEDSVGFIEENILMLLGTILLLKSLHLKTRINIFSNLPNSNARSNADI